MKELPKGREIVPYWNTEHTKYAVIIQKLCNGWSTSNFPEMAYDSEIVKYLLEHMSDEEWKDQFNISNRIRRRNDKCGAVYDFEKFLESIGYKDVYVGDMDNVKIVWVDSGRKWHIIDATGDGGEEILFLDSIEWKSFE